MDWAKGRKEKKDADSSFVLSARRTHCWCKVMIGTGQASEQTYIINQSSQGKRDAVFEGRLYHGQAPSERLK
jgi:hypothetical protein